MVSLMYALNNIKIDIKWLNLHLNFIYLLFHPNLHNALINYICHEIFKDQVLCWHSQLCGPGGHSEDMPMVEASWIWTTVLRAL